MLLTQLHYRCPEINIINEQFLWQMNWKPHKHA